MGVREDLDVTDVTGWQSLVWADPQLMISDVSGCSDHCCAHCAGHCKTDTEARHSLARLGQCRYIPPSSAALAGCPSPAPTRLRLPIYSCEGLGPPTYKFRPATNYSGVDFVRFPASDRHQGGRGVINSGALK